MQAHLLLWRILADLAKLEEQSGNTAAAGSLRKEAAGQVAGIVKTILDAGMRTAFLALARAEGVYAG